MSRSRPLTDREKRFVRYASIGIAIYLVLFGGFKTWGFFEGKRVEYRDLAQEAQDLKKKTEPYKDKVRVVNKMMDDFHLDPAKLKRQSVVSEANAAIQNAARSGGLALSSVRETPTRGSGMSLATIQLDSSGQIPAALSFLASLNTIGYPLIVDSVQFTSENRPGQIKMSLTIIILDFDQQKEAKEATHA